MNRFFNGISLVLGGCCLLAPELSAANWPGFRGLTQQGVSPEHGLPTKWSVTENIRWRIELPGESWSSPIVWGNRIFVTTAIDNGTSCRVLALARETGQLLWNREVFKQIAGHSNDRNGFATPTPCTDGERVYAAFGDGSFAAVDYSGQLAWTNRDFTFYGEHGLGTSPILWNDLLIMARDGSHPPPDTGAGWHTPWDQGYLVALDTRTGRVRWKASRGLSRIAHVVPAIWTPPNGPTQVISGAGDVVQAFDAATGKRIWSAKNIGEGVVPSIVVGENMAFTASGWGGRESIKAFRLEGQGDLGESNLAWEQKKTLPRIPSFLYLKPYLYTITESGIAMCLEGATGKIIWQERIPGNYSASPVAIGQFIYFLSDAGETTVINAGPEFTVLSRNPLKEKVQASMAVSEGSLFIRTATGLYCIGKL